MNINNKQYLLSYLKKRLIPNIDNKDNKGEVFTSIECIEHILEKLNKHYKNKHGICIFSNKNLRWLDPSSGIGNFMIIITLEGGHQKGEIYKLDNVKSYRTNLEKL